MLEETTSVKIPFGTNWTGIFPFRKEVLQVPLILGPCPKFGGFAGADKEFFGFVIAPEMSLDPMGTLNPHPPAVEGKQTGTANSVEKIEEKNVRKSFF